MTNPITDVLSTMPVPEGEGKTADQIQQEAARQHYMSVVRDSTTTKGQEEELHRLEQEFRKDIRQNGGIGLDQYRQTFNSEEEWQKELSLGLLNHLEEVEMKIGQSSHRVLRPKKPAA